MSQAIGAFRRPAAGNMPLDAALKHQRDSSRSAWQVARLVVA